MAEAKSRLIVMAPTPPPVFGQSVLTLSLLASLRRNGMLAAHVDTRDDRSLANLNRLDLENVRLGLLAAWRLVRAMRRAPGAAVYVQVSQGAWGFLRDALWVWIARAAGRRVYLHLHGGRFHDFHDESPPPLRWLIALTVAQAHEVWVLTPSLRRCFAGMVAPERVRVLENVVADPADQPVPLGPRRGEEGGPRVLFLSNLREGKGHEDLLEALALLGARAAAWHVRIVGAHDEETLRSANETIASRIDPSVRVDIVGPLTGAEKANELRWANVFAYPSRYRLEGQPLVVLEALAAGLPIVTTRLPGIADTVAEDAVVIEPGDVDALAAALERLAGDEDLRRRLGAAARARYEARYSPERLDESLEQLLGSAGSEAAEFVRVP